MWTMSPWNLWTGEVRGMRIVHIETRGALRQELAFIRKLLHLRGWWPWYLGVGRPDDQGSHWRRRLRKPGGGSNKKERSKWPRAPILPKARQLSDTQKQGRSSKLTPLKKQKPEMLKFVSNFNIQKPNNILHFSRGRENKYTLAEESYLLWSSAEAIPLSGMGFR